MQEIWVPIKGYELRYAVSNLGKVKSLDYVFINRGGKKHRVRGKLLKPLITHAGYERVWVSKEGSKQRPKSVHRLVGFAFVDNPYNLPDINHKNGIKTDNPSTNLEWVTSIQNKHHWMASDIYVPPNQGEKNTFCKLTTTEVLAIKHLRKTTTLTARELGLKFNISRGHVFRILSGTKWKHLI